MHPIRGLFLTGSLLNNPGGQVVFTVVLRSVKSGVSRVLYRSDIHKPIFPLPQVPGEAHICKTWSESGGHLVTCIVFMRHDLCAVPFSTFLPCIE